MANKAELRHVGPTAGSTLARALLVRHLTCAPCGGGLNTVSKHEGARLSSWHKLIPYLLAFYESMLYVASLPPFSTHTHLCFKLLINCPAARCNNTVLNDNLSGLGLAPQSSGTNAFGSPASFTCDSKRGYYGGPVAVNCTGLSGTSGTWATTTTSGSCTLGEWAAYELVL